MSIRIGFMGGNYAQIAMLNYWDAKKDYEELGRLKDMCEEVLDLKTSLTNHAMVTITFAAMAIEAYLNDYAAEKMGDKLFKDNFDMLRPMGKLNLISKFLLNQEITNGSTLCNCVSELFKKRNSLVHCKSKDGSNFGMTEEQYQEYMEFCTTDDGKSWMIEGLKVDMTEPNAMLKDARNALLALKEVCMFFDTYDAESFAMVKLLFANTYVYMNSTTEKKIREVQHEFKVPVLNPAG